MNSTLSSLKSILYVYTSNRTRDHVDSIDPELARFTKQPRDHTSMSKVTPVQALLHHYWGDANKDKVWPNEIKVMGNADSETLLGSARSPTLLDRIDGDEMVASFLLGFMRADKDGCDMNPWLKAAQNVRLLRSKS